ncbi:pyridoxamine 5'-phosphate oxidase family protein [Actinomadura roseirufa]|uniref:pyridoxamine 5'-phosphate oxidase family protein n=1 Tax=Actinomadura roseirufa TaxID=2094049 RepID=UPI001041783B|nr:pyridoxamine 5'-phosphate oxidase family protein [Actinomadura roseirufa]
MRQDHNGLEVLDLSECRALLANAAIGRIVFTDRALPAVQPVGYVFDGEDVVIRTARDGRLAGAVSDAVVAFEVDEFDTAARTGWSVVIVGRARPALSDERIRALKDLTPECRVSGDRDRFITIHPQMISGRRISAEQAASGVTAPDPG